jgi:hypothetical protein
MSNYILFRKSFLRIFDELSLLKKVVLKYIPATRALTGAIVENAFGETACITLLHF